MPLAAVAVPATKPQRRAAHAVSLLALPSCLWRIGLALGLPLGYTAEGFEGVRPPGPWGPAYLIGLSVGTEIAALLALGLVQRWGEVVPRWVPYAGGRTVPPLAVLIPAWAGTAALAVLWTPFLFWWTLPHDGTTPAGRTIVGFLYLPLVAWAPILAALAVSYRRRRR